MNIGILGATGAVGKQMIECLEERKITINGLKLFSSDRNAGREIKFNNKVILTEKVKEGSFKGLDVVLGAVDNDLAKFYAKDIINSGAIFIDNSSAFRMDEKVPLVIPEINRDDIKKHRGIIANPNCSTIITLMAIWPINLISEIESMIASTYQAVSGAGINGINELIEETNLINKNKKTEIRPNVFKHQIAYNLIPSIGIATSNLYTTEEMKMQNESRKIMHLPNLSVSCTCVRVPVVRSHSISVTVITKEKINIEKVKNSIAKFDGVKLLDDLENDVYPMPINTTNKDIVEVGRIREDLVFKNGISLFCSGDQIRKGAASNAVDILECL